MPPEFHPNAVREELGRKWRSMGLGSKERKEMPG